MSSEKLFAIDSDDSSIEIKQPAIKKIKRLHRGNDKNDQDDEPEKKQRRKYTKSKTTSGAKNSGEKENLLPIVKKEIENEIIIGTDDKIRFSKDALPSKPKEATKNLKRRLNDVKENEKNAEAALEKKSQCSPKRKKAKLTTPKTSVKITNSDADDPTPIKRERNSFWDRRQVLQLHEILAETANIDIKVAKNIIELFNEDNTIPFICRYRRDLINNIPADNMREIKEQYTNICELRKKAETIVSTLEKQEQINDEIRKQILTAKTEAELEFLFAPYKPVSKGTLTDRAIALGLEDYAERLLRGSEPFVVLENIVDPNKEELDSYTKVFDGICHIVAHKMSKDAAILKKIKTLKEKTFINLKCVENKKATSTETSTEKSTVSKAFNKNKNDASKFQNYFNFCKNVKYIQPHQTLAINRGEKLKFLTVKVDIPDQLKSDLEPFIIGSFLKLGKRYDLRYDIIRKSFDECYSKKIQPWISRQIRADLKSTAKKASIEVFAQNLKQLLLVTPLKGEKILGIDPGFTNGCKLALISETADVIETGVIYPHIRQPNYSECEKKLTEMLMKNKCKIIALGNGSACRETEIWLTKLFEKACLDKNVIRYSIVSEQGASIYSCSEVAKKEFPNLDVNEISAVSIARRLNDPLSELVKIDAKHIGVGMYQHDVADKHLEESLNEVVSECVSFVGIDINTAGVSILKHVAGLTLKKAQNIVDFRNKNGLFRKRVDLKKIKNIGDKTFTQCAGFIRIEPKSLGSKLSNILDCTWVHPESYNVAEKIIEKCKLNINDIGSTKFISSINNFAMNEENIKKLIIELNLPKERIEVVLEALKRELLQDYRSDLDKRPLFKKGVTKIADLKVGDLVTGVVANITNFGAFVDIGIAECNGLIHISKMGKNNLCIRDRVECSILNVNIAQKRIGLKLEQITTENDVLF